jgi:polysaccharide deacetylase family protein (PEP-CTERM system associated)
MLNYLSVDVEDWFHFVGSRYSYPVEAWCGLESHLRRMTDRVLEVIHPRKATFFCLGWAARRHPEVIRSISDAGHEVGSHGMHHDPVFVLGRRKFRRDLEASRKILEDCCAQKVTAYRAPGFSIRPADAGWAFEEIHAAGYRLDSSVFPGLRARGGIPGASPHPYTIPVANGELREIPVSTAKLFGVRTAFCGGGFFRFFPYWLIRREIRRLNAAGRPAVVYIHPRDLEPEQPRMRLEPVNGFLYRWGLGAAMGKFQELMRDFAWGPLGEEFPSLSGCPGGGATGAREGGRKLLSLEKAPS